MRIRWVKVWVDAMASLTERFRDEEGRVDFEALGREEYAFRHALVTGDFSRSERARDLYDATINEITSRSEAGRKGAEARWSKNTADAPHREAGDERQHPSDGELLESGTSANQSGAGEVPPENVSAKPSPALPVLSFGEFGNIKMTNMQYAKLCERFSIADSVLAEADQYFEAQPSKKKKYKNHYAMLLNWCKRRETESKPKQGYKTAADRDREEIQKIADYYAAQERGEKPPMPKIQLVEGL